jgi:hypothetical protein
MTRFLQASAGLVLGGLLATSAAAQMQPRDPNMPDPRTVPAEKMEPGTTGSTGGTLSDRLERSEGIIKPPAIGDNEAVVSPPRTPSMPVITPPGTSPTDPLQPK